MKPSDSFQEDLVTMNEALVLGSLRQHELTEAAERLNARLEEEIAAKDAMTRELEVTARSLSEQARELAEKARLIDLSNDAIIVRDLEDKIRLWNKGAEKLFGWTFEEVKGEDLHSFLRTEFPKPKAEIIAQLYRDGPFNAEVVQTARDGRRVRSLCGWVLDRDTDSIFTSYTDITEYKKAEEALRVSEERFRFMTESLPQKIFTATPGGEVDYLNPLWMEFTGLDFGQMKGTGWVRFIHPDDLPNNLIQWQGIIDTGEPMEIQHRFLRADGTYRWHLSRAFAMRDSAGKVTMLLGSSTDFHDVKEIEESLARHTVQLAKADRSKDEFLAMLAHELRNPLAPLRNAAAILQTPGAPAEVREQAQSILARQVGNMARMIDDLLDVSRITEGKIELRREVVAIEAIFSAAVSMAEMGIEARGQELTVTLPTEPVFLNCDPTRLDQVFGNLLSNACKYSGPDSRISLEAERVGAEVIVRVRDNGIGIAADLLPHVFDLFVQATRASDRAYGGLGIGLTVVERLVNLHGGRVEVHSEGLGLGSEFVVHLPILPGREAPPPSSPAPSVERSFRMLIIDDNVDAAETMAVLQELRGHQTRFAHNGPAGIALAAEFLPEVVLLDIGLPGMDGYEVARELRAMPGMEDAFLVAMTGYGSAEDIRHAKEAGFDRHLVKPADLELLRDWLRAKI